MARSTGILLVLIVYILHNGDALKCMQCKKASEPGDCSTTVECPAGESCYTEFYISPEGFLFYDMGCEPERVCKAIADRKKRSVEKRAFETLPLCQECCTDDYCNAQGCLNQATPLVNTSVCYKCDDVKNPRDCSFVEPCVHDNEICAATQSLDFDNFEIRYKLECMSKQRCKAVRGSQTEGHPVSNHTRREIKSRDRNKRNGINTCLYCCEDDFCNDRECSKGPGHVISHPHKTTGVLTTKQTRTTQQFTAHKQYTTDNSTTKQTSKINTLHTTHKSTTTMQPKTTHRFTTMQPYTTHKSTTMQPSSTHKSTTKQPSTTHRSTTKQPSTTHRSATKLPSQTHKASSGAITKLTTLKATSNLIKISTVKPSSTKPTTQNPTSRNPNMSTWLSASTNKNPQQPTTLTPTQKSTLWISAYTNSRPPNWITVPTDTKPQTWVSAKTDPVIFATPNVGK